MKLHSNILGSGTPFLILHGFLGMSDNWKTLGREFSENGLEVHLIDQRNHGRSGHSSEFSYHLMAEDVKEYIQEHQLEDVILMGHSMGGKSAMTAACRFPSLVQKLLIVDIAPKYYPPHHQQILKGLEALEKARPGSRTQAEEILSDFVQEKGVQLFLLKNLYWKDRNELALRLNLPVLTEKIEALGEALPEDYRFDGPTLFIRGEKSDYIQPADEQLIKGHFPNSKIKEISKAGHWVHAENKKAFFSTVMSFL